ncbi:hypothetical protein KI387_011732, partial [Taxus chinensis]
ADCEASQKAFFQVKNWEAEHYRTTPNQGLGFNLNSLMLSPLKQYPEKRNSRADSHWLS